MFEQAFKNIDDVLWKEAGCTTELDYTEQTSWLLFLKYLDGLEQDQADEAALAGKSMPARPRFCSCSTSSRCSRPADAAEWSSKNTFLSNTDNASVSLRKLLLETCNLHTVLDCPGGSQGSL